MGSSNSKPVPTSQYVFTADTPVSFSEGLVNSLQTSAESDSTRAKDLELQIQARVTSELEKLLAASSDKLSSASEAVSKEPLPPSSQQSKSSSGQSWTEKPLLTRIAETFTGTSSQKHDRSDVDSSSVSKEIEELKKKLAARKQMQEVDKDVAAAKQEVVKCLQLNDRRPLDCWKEVEAFKTEVGKLERRFVSSNGG